MVRRKNVIAVMSPKGGVGKTVTTANLAVALATEYNKKVLAIDTNISTASLGMHLDIFYPKTTIHDVLEKNFSIKNAMQIYHSNLHVIPASIKLKRRDKSLNSIRKNVEKIVQYYDKILKELSKEYDLVLLDCAPGFDVESIAAMKVAGGLIFVTNPEYPAVVTIAKAMEYASILKIPVGGLVLNKVGNKKYEITSQDIEDALKIKVIEKIPFDKKVSESIANRKPIVLFKPRNKASKAYKRLAATIIGEKPKEGTIKKIFKSKKR